MIYTCYTSHTMHILCKHIFIYIYIHIVIQDMSYRYGSISYRSRYIMVICKSRWAVKPMDKDKQKWCKISVECLAIDVVDLSLSLGKLIAWRIWVWIQTSKIRGWTSAPQDGNFGQEHSCPSQSLAVFIFFYILDLYNYIYYFLSYNRFEEHIYHIH